MRLAHFLSQQGIASRRKAEELIAAGKVSVNGKIILIQGSKVDPEQDTIVVEGRGVINCARAQPELILFHKPRNVLVTKRDPQGRPTIFDYLKTLPGNFNPVGRLDFDSEGLVLLTNDGDLHQHLAHPSFEVTKVYEVKVSPVPGKEVIAKLAKGVDLEDGQAVADEIVMMKQNPHNAWLHISIHQGRNRIIRRMCASVGLKVLRLKRIAIGPYRLDDLPAGVWRRLPYQKGRAFPSCKARRG